MQASAVIARANMRMVTMLFGTFYGHSSSILPSHSNLNSDISKLSKFNSLSLKNSKDKIAIFISGELKVSGIIFKTP